MNKSAAVLTFHDAENYTSKGARQIAAWLRRQADYISRKEFRSNVAKRYTARYLYNTTPQKKTRRKNGA